MLKKFRFVVVVTINCLTETNEIMVFAIPLL